MCEEIRQEIAAGKEAYGDPPWRVDPNDLQAFIEAHRVRVAGDWLTPVAQSLHKKSEIVGQGRNPQLPDHGRLKMTPRNP